MTHGFFEAALPPEMQDHLNRHKIAEDSFRHDLQRLFTELDSTQLQTLFSALGNLSSLEDPDIALGIWMGQISWEQQKRFNICPWCRVDHDKEFDGDQIADQVNDPNPQVEDETYQPYSPEWWASQPRHNDGTLRFTSEEKENMKLYHLDDSYDEETMKFLGFACTGIKGAPGPCGLTYPSIADRMLREPESCHGCFERVAHG